MSKETPKRELPDDVQRRIKARIKRRNSRYAHIEHAPGPINRPVEWLAETIDPSLEKLSKKFCRIGARISDFKDRQFRRAFSLVATPSGKTFEQGDVLVFTGKFGKTKVGIVKRISTTSGVPRTKLRSLQDNFQSFGVRYAKNLKHARDFGLFSEDSIDPQRVYRISGTDRFVRLTGRKDYILQGEMVTSAKDRNGKVIFFPLNQEKIEFIDSDIFRKDVAMPIPGTDQQAFITGESDHMLEYVFLDEKGEIYGPRRQAYKSSALILHHMPIRWGPELEKQTYRTLTY